MSTPDPWEQHRALLFTVAYELLGSVADAEDVVQETWLRWSEVDRSTVRDERAYLARIATRQALNRLRTLQRRRETYVGPWLPEPLLTAPDVAEDVELTEAVSMAMLRVLDSLTPTERAVFVLREVFGFGYADIAAAVDKSEPAVRQVASRARSHVQARRPGLTAPDEVGQVVERFMAAAAGGDLQALMDLLAPDCVLLTDGGGKAQAALRPIQGRDKVARFIGATSAQGMAAMTAADSTYLNGLPALRIWLHGELAVTVQLRIDHGLVTELYFVRNPDKLTRLEGEALPISR
ncbi:RNA polymerase sigma-70 factor [Nocardioides guangzhouensis]|uniref:RNA polymerase sigma-70 factor n=1 Tax=Nocardioides guangzhouensis TaxID=2497878 RepID=A0A4Q4ZII7_9ACTN|nr:RNA polymerase sigma-70 factor [Nocardioides guangzhouensis]RYP88050.1 RNA polymerase sigma-70 factor [Nocardioides guangzhouensis]